MTPEEIAVVRATWALALRDVDSLAARVAEGLSSTPEENLDRARWAVSSITRLVVTLDRPAVFQAAAQSEIVRLPPFTLEGLAVVRAAVLDALRRLDGELPPPDRAAWEGAFDLFHELVAAQHLDPFHPQTQTPTPSTPTETRS